jgi:hypothetical protein
VNYIIYKKIDGDIRCSISCLVEDIDINCGEDEAYMEHQPVDDSKYKVDLDTLDVVPIEPEP